MALLTPTDAAAVALVASAPGERCTCVLLTLRGSSHREG